MQILRPHKFPRSLSLALCSCLLIISSACTTTATAPNPATETPPAENVSDQIAQADEGLSPGEQANADFQDKLSGTELLNALKQGGHVIYFRHAQTEKDYADQVTADVNNCATQRVLSEVGWQQARTIGKAFEAKDIPYNQVISSQYCRAWKTADLAFSKYEKNPALNFLPFEDYTDTQVEEMKANVMPLLTAIPPNGTNTIIVGHDDIFESATGIYPDPQGIAYIVTPDGQGGFELVANMLPKEWGDL
ncbi:Phosphoglycerate mutase [Thalassoporum mexicanum PCC 7367]|uniref:histidine phosphatase family protein n=1 Tax=Thalassoporum mexicanum TaxID=3457544 RepID=UPI00029FB180|nr:histidine phosphatase family protein [Pseudanabaena sp. PCC 7367]AFY69741.1 Phosphoglycerate mutase [Pseudanabaena sp. PCC 7367]